jgi:hypothetical protein
LKVSSQKNVAKNSTKIEKAEKKNAIIESKTETKEDNKKVVEKLNQTESVKSVKDILEGVKSDKK